MKKLLFAVSLAAACGVNAADFRNANWGMSPEQVIKSEKIKLKKDTFEIESLRYYSTFNGEIKLLSFNAAVLYVFNYDKLVEGRYVIKFPDFLNSKKIFQTISNILIRKYGQPQAKEKLIFVGKCNKGKPTLSDFHKGKAILESTWQRKKLTLKVSLEPRENYDIEYNKKAPKMVYILFINYAIPNPKKALTKWKQEDAQKAVARTEAQL